MTNSQAKQIVITILSQSSFMRGFLFGKGAWSAGGFPSRKTDPEELKALIATFREIADAIEIDEEGESK